jgi:hypothetical protein
MKKFINHVDHVAWISKPENPDVIDYANDVIPFGDAKRAVSAKTG